jgi:glycine betaine monooxygenase A
VAILENPASSTTLPREFYCEGPLFESEVDRLWYRQWLYLAHACEVPRPGDYVVRDVLGESVLVVRTADEQIRAMLNVCRHRGSRVVDDTCGHATRFKCPYHQWTYGLDGSLLGAPEMRGGNGIDFAELGLYTLPVDTWRGVVFGCLGTTPPSPISAEIEALCPTLAMYRPERLKKVAAKTYDATCNWKVLLENYLECYHCAGSHPEYCLTARIDLDDDPSFVASFTQNPYWALDLPLREGAKTASMDNDFCCRIPLVGRGDAEKATGCAVSFSVQPCFTALLFYADYAMVHEIRPVSATTTQFHIHWFLNEEAGPNDYDLSDLTHVWDQTTLQDVELVERAQLGLRSRRYSPGPLNIVREPAIRAALGTYLDMMGDDDIVRDLMEPTGGVPSSSSAR